MLIRRMKGSKVSCLTTNNTYCSEENDDPKEDFINDIKSWAADAHENEEIDN